MRVSVIAGIPSRKDVLDAVIHAENDVTNMRMRPTVLLNEFNSLHTYKKNKEINI